MTYTLLVTTPFSILGKFSGYCIDPDGFIWLMEMTEGRK